MKGPKKRKEITPLHIIAFLIIFTVLAPYILYYLCVFVFRIVEIAKDAEFYLLIARSFALVGLGIAAFLIAWFFLLPIILFIFRRIKCYFSLFFVCLKNGFKIRLCRLPFTPLFGVRSREDIKIITPENVYCLHFIDIIFRAHRGFRLINDKEYSMSVRSAQLGLWGGGFIRGRFNFPLTTAYSTMETSFKAYLFPEFDTQSSKHIIIVHPTPNHCVFIDRSAGGDGTRPLYSGYSVGDITYYSAHGFLKFLKRI